MNLVELLECTPKVVSRETEAVQLLRVSMEAIEKVRKTARIHFGGDTQQQNLIIRAIEKELADFDVIHILWKGVYGEPTRQVQFWFFMHGYLVIRGVDGTWSFMSSKWMKKRWERLVG